MILNQRFRRRQRWTSLCQTIQLLFVLNITSALIDSSFGYIPTSLLSNYGGSTSAVQSQTSSNFGSTNVGGSQGPVTTAIESTRTVEVKPVQTMSEPHEPQVVEVPSEDMPVTVHFKSQSSRVLVQQTHTPAQISEPEHTTSEDEPQRVIHEVVKPVIQEIREIIQPYRRLIQQVQPVIEQTHTVIAKGEPRPAVEPISVEGASPGTLSSPAAAGGFGSDSRMKFGSSTVGHSNNYASAASSISLKTSSPSSNNEQLDRKRSVKVNTAMSNQPATYLMHQSSSSSSLKPSSSIRSESNTKSIHPSSLINGQDQNQIQILKFTMQPKSNNGYASRRGEFVEPKQMEKFEAPKISLRPAPSTVKATPSRIRLRAEPSMVYPKISESYRNNFEYQQPRIESRFDQDPLASIASYPFESNIYSMPLFSTDNFAPMITFVAQPIRFRARA
ncbi:hypothetical protein SSS_03326 [Sarcoptes scabiei]|uniref:Uncharacterized protein n=2 Tax=Sarcoptes scabiei TaxID=52283 RepID=A0A834RHA7_SARSC|nr:hypothetical protein SSS_03326 [Sarcoptes scabiei]